MEILNRVHALYRDPHSYARAWKAQTGGKVAGCLGLDIPQELIAAAGILPVRVLPLPGAPLDAARSFCEGASGPVLSSLAARLLDGTYDYLDYLVIATRPAYYGELYAFFRELGRTEARPSGPAVLLFDLHHDAKASTRRFNLDSVKGLKAKLEEWSGKGLSPESIQAAIAAGNQSRRLLRQLNQLRMQCRLQGSDMLALAETANLMERDEHNGLLEDLLKRKAQLPHYHDIRLIYSGSDTDDLSIYRAIEAAGGYIVADDQDRGTRQLLPLIEEHVDPLQALAQRYTRRAPSSWGFRTGERIRYLGELVEECHPAAVVFYILAADHPTAWDYPALRDSLEQAGIQSVRLGSRLYGDRQGEPLTERIREFLSRQVG